MKKLDTSTLKPAMVSATTADNIFLMISRF